MAIIGKPARVGWQGDTTEVPELRPIVAEELDTRS